MSSRLPPIEPPWSWVIFIVVVFAVSICIEQAYPAIDPWPWN